jgi:hypothetical protein
VTGLRPCACVECGLRPCACAPRGLPAPIGAAGSHVAHLTSIRFNLSPPQALDLSHTSHSGGLPAPLLVAVAELSRLTRLSLAGGGAAAPPPPASPSAPARGAAGGGVSGADGGLRFLSRLPQLQVCEGLY